MLEKEIFNRAQIESEQLAKIAVEFAEKTHGGEVRRVRDLAGVVKDGIFYAGSIDGVGKKILVAAKLGSYYQLGFDVVFSNTNDLARFGVAPKLLLPIVTFSEKHQEEMRWLTAGICDAAADIGVPVTGGETEVLRGIFENSQTINVALAVFGWIEVERLITSEHIQAGDGLFILPSSGIHTNGFSEIVDRFEAIAPKEILFDLSSSTNQTVGEWLTKSTANFLPDIRLFREAGIEIRAAENVTGGGFAGRLSKLLETTNLEAKIDRDSWPIPPIFEYLQQKFSWTDEQMFATFNMGAGMFLLIAQEDARKAIDVVAKAGRKIFQIGKLEPALKQASLRAFKES